MKEKKNQTLNSPVVVLFSQAAIASPLCNQQVELSASDELHRGPKQCAEKEDKNQEGNIRSQGLW